MIFWEKLILPKISNMINIKYTFNNFAKILCSIILITCINMNSLKYK